MKTVLLPVHDDKGQEARLQAALDLARALSGHLTCIEIAEMPPLPAGPSGGIGHGVLVAQIQEQERANRQRLRDRLAIEGVAWDWREMSGAIASCLAQAAGLADLIVTTAQVPGFLGLDTHPVAAELLIRSRTPILAVPDGLRCFDVTAPAILSWDGSRQVMAALRAAAPVLTRAGHVVIVEVDDGSVETPAEQAAAYLSRYGIRSTVQREEMRWDPVVTTLNAAIKRHAAGLVVMGAFKHWRMTEAIFGGVSRAMLLKSPVPLFMAH